MDNARHIMAQGNKGVWKGVLMRKEGRIKRGTKKAIMGALRRA
jgi:hypothetical protein